MGFRVYFVGRLVSNFSGFFPTLICSCALTARRPPCRSRGEYFDLLGDNHRGIVSNFRQPVEKFPNFMKNTTVKIGPKHEKMPKYGIFIVEKFLTIVEYFLIFHKIFTPE